MMPAPRKEDVNRRGDDWSHGREQRSASALPEGRPRTETEIQRRRRHGIPSTGSHHRPELVWSEPNPRAALPFRPYVYRGTGADAFTGEVVL